MPVYARTPLRPAAALAVVSVLAASFSLAHAATEPPCDADAMLVFDGSGSMSGNERLGIGSVVTRIDKVRKALGDVLPAVAPLRRLGLVTYGPGPYNRCDNIELNLRPTPDAAATIMDKIDSIIPAGPTPLTAAVEAAAVALDIRNKPGVVVLLTDGEETCGGNPCALAKRLKAEAKDLTIHVIGYRMKDFSWTGGAGLMDMRCLAEATGGTYTSPDTSEELVAALSKTLGCPNLTWDSQPDRSPRATRPHRQSRSISPTRSSASCSSPSTPSAFESSVTDSQCLRSRVRAMLLQDVNPATDPVWLKWIRSSFGAMNHPIP